MTDEVLTRGYDLADVEVAGDGRTLTLACLPYERPATVDDGAGPYEEAFQRGAFANVVKAPNRVELRYWHDQADLPYGFGVSMREDPKYLIGDFRAAKSSRGDHLLALVEDGLRGVSVGYVPDPAGDLRRGSVVLRTRVKRLKEVSLTPAAAFAGAEVLAVREESVDVGELAARVERERLFWAKMRVH